ncbi:cell division protein FtsX [Halomonas sp. E19]|uniref:cell division protein FtsX n=1 Tax=Halomonas sp. E19 TaxID=3397247 RepID=UPI004034B73E
MRRPIGSLLTMLAIAIALVLPAALWLTLDGARLLDAELTESATLTLYLVHDAGEAQAGRIEEAVAAHEGVARTRLISAAEGMAEFQQALGLADALGRLEDNPLPASIVVVPEDPGPRRCARWRASWSGWPASTRCAWTWPGSNGCAILPSWVGAWHWRWRCCSAWGCCWW